MSYLEFLCSVEARMIFPGCTDSTGGKGRCKGVGLVVLGSS